MERHGKDEAAASGEGQAAEAGGERIAKVLARAGVASRREVERLIEAGRVAVNGQTLTTPAFKVSPADQVTLDGRLVAKAEPTRLFRYHKPTGLVTTHSDPKGRPTVFEALPPGLPRLISVGRLDLNSEGLLLLTNDGELARRLELPATGLTRRYRARARGRVDQAKLDRLKEGVTVEGVHYGPIEAFLDDTREGAANQWIVVSLTEGKNREVRKVLEALGLTVNRLIRLTYGPYELGALRAGEVQELPAPSSGAVGVDGPGLRPAKVRAGNVPRKPGTGPKPQAALLLPKAEGKLVRKPGWAKPKIKPSGSRPGPGPRAGPRGPKPSASPPRSSGARRPGPRPKGGPKRRG